MRQPVKYRWLLERLSQPFGDECVEWPFGKNKKRYGKVSLNAKGLNVTHIALESIGKPRPESPGDKALHHCDNPPCFNPKHLYWGTDSDNQKDVYARNRRGPGGANGETHPNSKLTELDIHVIFALRSLGFTQKEIGTLFGTAQTLISKILGGKSWAHLGLVEKDVA